MSEHLLRPAIRRRRASRFAGRADVPTLRAVARAADVSTASASRALNRPERVSADVSGRVAAAAAALGYMPNHAGRVLSSLCSGVVGLLAAEIESAGSSSMVAALQRALAEAGYATMVACAGGGAQGETQIRMLLQRGVDAIVLLEPSDRESLEALPAARGVPLLLLGSDSPGQTGVGVDVAIAAATVAGFLHSLGHRQVAMLGTTLRHGMATARYLPALRRALAQAGLEVTADATVDRHDDFAAARAATRELLGRGAPATAIVCGGDVLAAGVARECGAMRIAIPDQLSVVGFGDLEIARQTQPALTTIRVPFDKIGRQVVASLRAQIDRGVTMLQDDLSGKLIARGSTAAAPS